MIENGNFRGQQTPSNISGEYKNCSFAHPQPVDTNGVKTGHRLFPSDDTPRTFINCNLVNCEPPPGSTLLKCNTTIVSRGIVSSTDSIVIDGEEITVDDYSDVIHGKYTENGYIYQEDKEVNH